MCQPTLILLTVLFYDQIYTIVRSMYQPFSKKDVLFLKYDILKIILVY